VTDDLDIVAVGVKHEGAVIMLVVERAQAGRAVVGGARRDRRGMERVDLLARLGAEGEMDARRRLAGIGEPEERLAVGAEAGDVDTAGHVRRKLHHDLDAERLQRCRIKPLRRLIIGDAEAGVVDFNGHR
jgi:hypothetical protein